MKPRFPKATAKQLEANERKEFSAIVALATKPFPKLNGNILREDGWNTIGCPDSWTNCEWSFEKFLEDVGTRKRLLTTMQTWSRINPNSAYCAANLQVVLKPEWHKEVCNAISEEMGKSKNIDVILEALNKMNCPSSNGKAFIPITLREFVRVNKITAKRVEEFS